MGPRGVVVRAWVLEGGGGACMGPRGGVGGACMGPRGGCVHGSYRGGGTTPTPPPPPNHTQLDHLPVHHLPAPPPARQCMGKCALQECRVGVLYMECRVGVLYIECF